jgi:hypothetical protein
LAKQFAGKKGKCKKCHTIITVPDEDETGISFEIADITHADPDLQRIYLQLITKADQQIVRHAIHDKLIVLEFRSGDWNERSQLAVIATIETDEIGKCLSIYSQVGTIDSAEKAYLALRAMNSMPLLTVCVDDDNTLSVRCLLPMAQSTDNMLLTHVALVAKAADILEEKLFGWDLK